MKTQSPIRFLVTLIAVIFIAEAGIMLLLNKVFTHLPALVGAILDSLILIVLSFPVLLLYSSLFRSFILEIQKRKQTEEELKEAYARLKETQSQLIQVEKMASLGQMTAGVAHEINNPLAVISGETEMLLRDKDKDEGTKDTSKIIMEQVGRIKDIVRILLDYSHKREFKLGPVNINDVLVKSLSLLKYQTKIDHIEVINELDSSLPRLAGDTNQLHEVFLNIMLNAVQAMEGGGKLNIKTYRDKIGKDSIRKSHVFKLNQEIAVVEFKDTGKGMDEVALRRLFDPFFTNKEKSTGLGLFICYGIIESHHGTIEANSKLGEGSTFIVKMPIPREEGGV
jgi:signal transduction histidine kinase